MITYVDQPVDFYEKLNKQLTVVHVHITKL